MLDIKEKRHITVVGRGGASNVEWDDIQNKPNFATVATTGDYDDLTDKPTILTQWFGTQAEYDAILEKDPNVIYNIEGSDNVQADWNQSDSTADDYIKNKPTIPAAQVNSDWNANSGVAQILNKPTLATVATSGNYSDLNGTPTIPAAPVQSDWNEADSGSLAYIANKPTIPAAQVNSDWNSASGVSQILNKPNLATVATTGSYPDLLDRPSLATVAETGDYEDLDNKPTIPSETETLTFTLQGGTVVTLNVYVQSQTPYFYIENNGISDITFNIADSIYDPSNPFDLDIYGSTDQENWSLIGNTISGLMTATVPANGKLYLKANTDSWHQTQLYNANIKFNISDPVNVGGNIMSLLYGDDYKGKKVFPTGSSQNFTSLFENCSIVSAEDLILPATTLTPYCYQNMFSYCTSLTTAPALPATTLAENCYSGMFYGCTALTTAPVLPAATLAIGCYMSMFSDCSSLDTITTYAEGEVPDALMSWVDGVAASGDFYNLGNYQYYESGANGIPTGWTVHTSL